jgi:hypothetical protein
VARQQAALEAAERAEAEGAARRAAVAAARAREEAEMAQQGPRRSGRVRNPVQRFVSTFSLLSLPLVSQPSSPSRSNPSPFSPSTPPEYQLTKTGRRSEIHPPPVSPVPAPSVKLSTTPIPSRLNAPAPAKSGSSPVPALPDSDSSRLRHRSTLWRRQLVRIAWRKRRRLGPLAMGFAGRRGRQGSLRAMPIRASRLAPINISRLYNFGLSLLLASQLSV